MGPLKPEEKQEILKDRPQASPADIEEYEKLLAARFAQDPSPPAAPAEFAPFQARADDRELRLAELHAKLYGPA